MKIHEIISTEDKWTNDAFAKDEDYNSVSWNDPSAVRFDFLGAYLKAYSKTEYHGYVYANLYKTEEMSMQKSLPFISREWGWEKVYNFCVKYDI